MTVKFGLIGLGNITTRLASVLVNENSCELVAAASRDQNRLDTFVKQFKPPKKYRNYLDLIRDDNVDVVYIGLINSLHFDITKLCLEHHKAVLCEKPLTLTEKSTQELFNSARENNTLLMEALWTRCIPAFQKAKEWVESMKIGQVKLITANFCFKTDFDPTDRLFDPKLGGGSLFDLGVYLIDLTTGILSEYPDQVSGLAKLAPSGVDQSAVVTLTFPSGALASLSCCFEVNAETEAVIYGTEGRIVLDNCYGPKICERYNDENQLEERFTDPVPDGFVYQLRHFAGLFREGKLESDLMPWEDTLACTRIFDILQNQWGLT